MSSHGYLTSSISQAFITEFGGYIQQVCGGYIRQVCGGYIGHICAYYIRQVCDLMWQSLFDTIL